MKTFLILNFLLINFTIAFAQFAPDHYNLFNEKYNLNKINSASPLSNTITDIIIIGDTVWLGTSRGISLSIDNGTTWTNFCLLYTSDAADERSSVDLGGRRIIKTKMY